MVPHYFKTIWRSFLKDRQFAVLNLVGLSVALTCVLLIYLWVNDELRVDKFHANDQRLYQVMAHILLPDGIHTQENTPYLLSRALGKEMPEVEYSVSLQKEYAEGILSFGEKHIRTTRYYADHDFFKMFSFPLLEGNQNNALNDKNSVLISDKLAKKLFNTTKNLLGKPLVWENDKEPFKISGIFAEPAGNSSMKFDVLFAYELYYQQDTANANQWANSNPYTFLLLKKGINEKQVEHKLTGFLHAKYKNSPLTLSLRKYSDRYLYNSYENGKQSGGRIRYVKLFSVIAVFILIIACINFMNLSTAKATRRLKEAGIKKILGAERSALIFQYLGESMFMVFTALWIALLLTILILPHFNLVTGKSLAVQFNSSFMVTYLSIGLITGLLAGSYPAFYLSGFKPLIAIKGKLNTLWGELWMRKGLVVFQYTLSVMFILAVLVIYKQMKFIQTIDLGYTKENIITFRNEKKINDNFNSFMNEVRQIPGVSAASSFDGNMFGSLSGNTEHANWENNHNAERILFSDLDVDFGLMELLGIKMKEGRTFSENFSTDSFAIILNEAAVNAMGIKNPIGKRFDVWGATYHIVGVAKDFHYESLYEKVKPCFMRCIKAGGNILVKVSGAKQMAVVSKLARLYEKYDPGLPFTFSFMDKDYQAMYVSEQRESTLFRWFAGLAITISCLGLFGLVAFSAQKRQKEMSIRKVVGASATEIAALLSKDFLKLVLLAVLISFPLSWWAMNSWLSNFAYHIHLGASMYLLALLSVLILTLFTISFQSIRTALANPVKSLRTE